MYRLLPATRVAGQRIAVASASRRVALAPLTSQPHLRIAGTAARTAGASSSLFHTSARQRNDAPKLPFQVFREVLSEEIKKNRELEQNVAQLKGEVGKVQDSEALKQARDAYERARVEWICFFSELNIGLSQVWRILTFLFILFLSLGLRS